MESQKSAARDHSSVSSLHQEEMNVYLKIVKTVPMKVKRSDSFGALKANINQKQGISEINQKLLFDGIHRSNAQTVSGCGVENHSTLHIFVNEDAVSPIFIKIPSSNKIITLEAKVNETTVHNVKSMIQEKEGFSSSGFTLLYNGNLLEDEMILASVGITNDSTIHLVFSKNQELSFSVKAQGMEAVKLSVKSRIAIGDVKAIAIDMLGERFGEDTGLYYAGKLLDDSETLAFYDVKEGSCLYLLASAPMEISVYPPDGPALRIDVQVLDNVGDIIEKAKEKMKCGADAVKAHLIYAGNGLKAERDLASYGIQGNSNLFMIHSNSH